MKILAKDTEMKIASVSIRIEELLSRLKKEIEIQKYLLTKVSLAKERVEIEENLREARVQKDNLVALLNAVLPVGNPRKAT